MWMLEGWLCWPALGLSPKGHHSCRELDHACVGSAWGGVGGTCCQLPHPCLPEAVLGTNKWEC